MNYGLVIAAGKGSKFGQGVDRAFLSLGPKPILAYSLLAFEACGDIDGVILVVRRERVEAARGLAQIFGCSKVVKFVAGAATRSGSVKNGLDAVPDDAKIITIHAASRPGVSPELISDTILTAKRNGAAAASLKIDDTVVASERGTTANESFESAKLWTLQSPQSFKIDILRKAIKKMEEDKSISDEASALKQCGVKVRMVPGSKYNIKILKPDDVPLAATLLKL